MLLTASGFIKSRSELMIVLIDIKHGWLPKVSNRGTG
jgi:hypothetical protein